MQAKHRRKSRLWRRPHEQFTVAMAILSVVVAGGMAVGLLTSVVESPSGTVIVDTAPGGAVEP